MGTPTWFGFGTLIGNGAISDTELSDIGRITAIVHLFAAFVIPVMALKVIVSWQQIRRNIVFILISILSCTVPYVVIAWFNYEFPALVGGAIGLFISVGVASKGIGLSKTDNREVHHEKVKASELIKALFPTASLIIILALTRIKQLPLKALLNDTTEWFTIKLGYLGDFEVTKGLIFSLNNIFATGENESYKLLYVPALIPFVVTVLISIPLFSLKWKQTKELFSASFVQIQKPFLALVGALIMVNVMLMGGENSMVQIIGLGVSVLLMIILNVVIKKTKIGKAIRAVSMSTETAALLGINPTMIISVTVMIASALGAAAGVLVGLSFNAIEPTMGVIIGFKGLAVLILGGLGNITGAMVGGFILGIAEIFSVAYGASTFRDAVAFGLIIVLLFWRPQGLFGSKDKGGRP